jgi:hypothetical protein
MSQLGLFEASSSAHDASPATDEPSGSPDDAWAQLMERQRAYLELRYEQQRQAGLKRRNASREEPQPCP